VKVASYTVHADAQQSVRWNRAAEGEGFTSTGAWLAAAADSYLKARARAGMPIPLAWRRGRFRVALEGREAMVSGQMSLPFGTYHGTPSGPIPHGSTKYHSLVYLPTGRIMATFHSARQCKALASELARLWVRGDGSEPSGNPAPIIPIHPA
jgi:hypothetical protein